MVTKVTRHATQSLQQLQSNYKAIVFHTACIQRKCNYHYYFSRKKLIKCFFW